jgi:hypothetical protein
MMYKVPSNTTNTAKMHIKFLDDGISYESKNNQET